MRLPESLPGQAFQPVARHRTRGRALAYGQAKARSLRARDRDQREVRQVQTAPLGKHPPKLRLPEQACATRKTILWRDIGY